MFSCFIENRKLQYTIYDGDGESGSFESAKEVLNEKSGDEYPITKENCIGHKTLWSKTFSRKIYSWISSPDRCNCWPNPNIMLFIITKKWHNQLSYMDNLLPHEYCLVSSNSWCKCQFDDTLSTTSYSTNQSSHENKKALSPLRLMKCLLSIFRKELTTTFYRLAADDLTTAY